VKSYDIGEVAGLDKTAALAYSALRIDPLEGRSWLNLAKWARSLRRWDAMRGFATRAVRCPGFLSVKGRCLEAGLLLILAEIAAGRRAKALRMARETLAFAGVDLSDGPVVVPPHWPWVAKKLADVYDGLLKARPSLELLRGPRPEGIRPPASAMPPLAEREWF
jgi:hypothetical protein